MALIFDEINVCGELAFKIVNGEYHFFGLIDAEMRPKMFGSPSPTVDISEHLQNQIASHALIFQARGKILALVVYLILFT